MVSATAVLAYVKPEWPPIRGWDADLDDDELVARDYTWILGLEGFTHSEGAWLSFRDGYRVGGEIGRRGYAAGARPLRKTSA